MSGPKIELKIDMKPTVEQLKKELGARHKKLSAFKHVHKKAAIFLDQWVQQNFKSEGGKVGGWLPFAAGGRWRKGKGLDTSAKLLQDTGRLRLSYLPFATTREAGIGSKLPYSKSHEQGLGVPVRRVLPVDKDVRGAILSMFDAHARGVTK